MPNQEQGQWRSNAALPLLFRFIQTRFPSHDLPSIRPSLHSETKGPVFLAPAPTITTGAQFWLFETLTLTCFGLDSARFGSSTVRTPFLYSALIASVLTVFGKLKLRLNEP
jgi:hypothetical protein